MRESGEALIHRVGISNGLKVLDLGCGDGTTAIPAAKLGAEVLGVDIASNLVAAGNKRAKDLGLANCRFHEGDAANLHQAPQQAFDLVVSIFGAMFAPKPFEVAKEMVRVTRPEGRIIMGNWIPDDPTLVAQILRISSAYTSPPPEGFVSPMTWGIESNVILRFGSAGVPAENISFARDTFTFHYPYPPAAFANEFRKYYGPTMNAFEAAEKINQALICRKSSKNCSISKTKALARKPHPFLQPSSASRLRFERVQVPGRNEAELPKHAPQRTRPSALRSHLRIPRIRPGLKCCSCKSTGRHAQLIPEILERSSARAWCLLH